jgi:hypothetical protein
MSRPQFTVRALLVAVLVVGAGLALWTKSLLAALAVIGAPLALIIWLADWGVLEVFLELPRFLISLRSDDDQRRDNKENSP